MAAPRVSIGLPVYNGEKYLRLALDSLLAQDYGDFELIIADNASTDGTAGICQQRADRDQRVRFIRNDRNIGAVANFNNVFRLSSGEYFMWAAHDDLWHPSYVGRCLECLMQDPNIVLCASAVRFIDELGGFVAEAAWRDFLGGGYNKLDTRSLPLRERLRKLTRRLNWFALYGLMRSDVLRQTRLYQEGYGGDVILLMELLFQGETHVLDETLFLYRLLPKTAAVDSAAGDESRHEQIPKYTDLAIDLLDTIDRSRFSPDIKRHLREDLLENVSLNNAAWVGRIALEHPSVARANGPYARSARIQELLARRLSDFIESARGT